MPEISVIVPVYNCESYLADCLDSILQQSFEDFEIILLDDQSPDKSGEICDAYAQKDCRIKVVHKENEGAGKTRNLGVSMAAGEYLSFVDPDDAIEPDMLKNMYEAAKESGADVVICGYKSYYPGKDNQVRVTSYDSQSFDSKESVLEYFAKTFPLGIVGYPWNKLYKASVIKENEIKFSEMRRFEDGIFNMDFFDKAESCKVIPDSLYRYKLSNAEENYRKLPKNLFDMVCVVTRGYYQKIEKWGFKRNDIEENIVYFFLNELIVCISCIHNPYWGYSTADKVKYFDSLSEDALTKELYARMPQSISRGTRLFLDLLMKRRYSRLFLLVRIKIFLKMHLNCVFRAAKKVVK